MDGQPFQTLGLDVGTNSLGWALVSNSADGSADSLVDCGVRIFQEAVDAKTREPKNHARRRARLARRLLSRRRRRKAKLRNCLIRLGWLPAALAEHAQPEILLNELDGKDGSQPGNPYLLRKKGLDETLSLHQFGRVLMHLCTRRGFQSNRKALLIGTLAEEYEDLADAADADETLRESLTKKDDEDLGKIKTEINGLWAEMRSRQCRTLGELLSAIPPLERKRARHTDRRMFKEEFDLLWQSQARFHETLQDDGLKANIHELIFFQRPLKSAKGLVAACSFEPLRKRAMRGRLDVQEFLLRQDLNHLELLNPETRQFESIAQEKRELLFSRLQQQQTLSWREAKKLIGVPYPKTQTFNLEESKTKLTGNRVACSLRSALPDRWDAMEQTEQERLIEDLLTISDKNHLIKRLRGHWQFNRHQAYALTILELPLGYANLSVKAINKLLPFMRQGLIYSSAREAAGYGHVRIPIQSMALLPEPPVVRNPVVQKALYEVRKVVNSAIRAYGKPAVVRVEMARDMVTPKKVLEAQEKQNKANRILNERAREALAHPSIGIANPRHDDLLKYRLWVECQEICPYTGKTISLTSLLKDGQWDIEHIHPYSRTLDDSYMNKTLCDAEFNRLVKKGQIPWEIKERTGGGWEALLQRIKPLPNAKKRRFLQHELGNIDDFVARQLNDTRYIAVAVKDYLAKLGVDVQFTRGGMTSDLRHHWGLNSILSDSGDKERKDHRHHAVDAIAIALTTRSLYQHLQNAAKVREQDRRSGAAKLTRFSIPQPWENFRDEVATNIDRIVISHAANRAFAGALHEDTAYGLIRRDGEEVFVYRKPLGKDFDAKQAEKIVDAKIRELVLRRLAEYGNDPKKAFFDLVNHPIYLNTDKNVAIKKVRIAAKVSKDSAFGIVDQQGHEFKYMKYGNNSHVELVEHIPSGRHEGRFVTTLEAAKRCRRLKQSAVQKEHGPDWRLVLSLAVNDLVRFSSNDRTDYFRVQMLDGKNKVIALRHHLAARIDDPTQRLFTTPTTFLKKGGEKVSVDPIGRVTIARD